MSQNPFDNRYNRNHSAISHAQQKLLGSARVLLVGLGGLGGCVAEQLARLGVGHIIGVDNDYFDATNLNRQLTCTTTNIGQAKTLAAQERLATVNPDVEFTGLHMLLDNVEPKHFKTANIYVDCLDNFPARAALAGLSAKYSKPVVHGAIGGWIGQVGTFAPDSVIYQNLTSATRAGLEETHGNPAPTVFFAASMMAAEIIKIIGQPDKPILDDITFFDLQTKETEHYTF